MYAAAAPLGAATRERSRAPLLEPMRATICTAASRAAVSVLRSRRTARGQRFDVVRTPPAFEPAGSRAEIHCLAADAPRPEERPRRRDRQERQLPRASSREAAARSLEWPVPRRHEERPRAPRTPRPDGEAPADGEPTPEIVRYNGLLRACFSRRRALDAVKLLEEMEEAGVARDLATYAIAAKGFLDCRRDDLFARAEADMRAQHVAPNVIYLNGVLAAYGKRGMLAEVEATWQRLLVAGLAPDEFSYSARIAAYTRLGRVAEARQLKGEMERAGVLLNEYIFTLLISGCAAEGAVAEAEALWAEYWTIVGLPPPPLDPEAAGGPSPPPAGPAPAPAPPRPRRRWAPSPPDVAESGPVWVALAEVYAKAGDLDRARAVKAGMLAAGLPVPPRLFNVIAHACADRGDLAGTMAVRNDMIRLGVRPDVITFTSFISAFVKQGDTNMAEVLFEEMRLARVRPDIKVYGALIDGLVKRGDVDAALRYFAALREDGLQPNRVVYGSVIEGLAGRALDTAAAEQLWAEMVGRGMEPTVTCYRGLMLGYARKGESGRVLELYAGLLASGREPDAGVLEALVVACAGPEAAETEAAVRRVLREAGGGAGPELPRGLPLSLRDLERAARALQLGASGGTGGPPPSRSP